VRDTVGFDFSASMYLRNSLVLLLQAAGWLALCAVLLKRLDRTR